MPHSRSLEALRRRLQVELDPRHFFRAPVWGSPRAMQEERRQVDRAFGGSDDAAPTQDLVHSSLRNFAQTQQVGSFNELKYVCYGVTVPVPVPLGESRWRLIDRAPLFNRLLELVAQQSAQVKRYRRCYQGLLGAYFGFDRHLEPSGEGQTQLGRLQDFLSEKLEDLRLKSARRGTVPPWLDVLREHRNLLGEDPCSRYAAGLVRKDPAELREVCAGLGISSNSWVWDEALMAYVKLVCSGADAPFKRSLPDLLDLVNERLDLRLPEGPAQRATGLTVARYARCDEHPEHGDLRDTAMRRIGNPWLQREAWDSVVKSEPARLMLESWLKKRLIKDFFELLAQDGGADQRRLKYWLKWEPRISDMWFVLGGAARANPLPAFEKFRELARGRSRELDDASPINNAFVMRIGKLLVIEYGLTGNACYVFDAVDIKADLDAPQLKTKYELKQAWGRNA